MKINVKKAGTREILFFLSLFLFSCVVTLTANQGRGILNSQSEIFADKAGYYIYLPATFFYHFDANKSPQGIDEKTGYGFNVDREHNNITTQYFYGVSFLISPFFMIAHAVSAVTGEDELGGFSLIYNKIFNVAAVFYLFLGLFFLKKFLKNYFPEYLQYILILLTFLGTNLFFYSIVDTLMSHVYSFFAISVFLYAMKEFLNDTSRYRYFLLMSFACGLMFIIRPTNCLIGVIFLFWDALNRKEIVDRLKLIFHSKYILPLLAIMFVMFIPQMVYWKIMRGTFLYIKYGEGFPFWNHPKFPEVWFSTLNGLVPWSPLILLFITGMFFMIFKRINNGILILFFFLLVSYMAGSYKFWYYGCGYGHRAFVEFYPVFCIPFGFLAGMILDSKKIILKISFVLLVVCMTFFNFSLSLVANRCNFGTTWDWDYYVGQLNRIYLFPESTLPFTFRNDFENAAIYNGSMVTDSISNSGLWSAFLDKDHETCCEHSAFVRDFKGKFPKSITVQLMVKKVKPGPVNALLVCSFEKNDTVYNTQSQPLEPFIGYTLSWLTVFKTFRVPYGLSGDTQISIYVWNKEKNAFFVDDLKIRYE
jgi:hypothetical protein